MIEMRPDARLIKTYVWHGDDCYFVSTIDRDSSSPLGGRFAETIVWAYDWEARQRGALLWTDYAAEGSIKTHQAMVEAIHRNGPTPPDSGEK